MNILPRALTRLFAKPRPFTQAQFEAWLRDAREKGNVQILPQEAWDAWMAAHRAAEKGTRQLMLRSSAAVLLAQSYRHTDQNQPKSISSAALHAGLTPGEYMNKLIDDCYPMPSSSRPNSQSTPSLKA